MQTIALFASGTGSNAVKIMEHFAGDSDIRFLVLSNKKEAPVLEKARAFGAETLTFNREEFYKTDKVIAFLQEKKTDFVALAGFLWLVPENLLALFPQRIINIHPALLPKFGGKGMHGMHVHRAVKAAGETETGITIHYADEAYDNGKPVFRKTCPVLPEDTPEMIAAKVLALEHANFAPVLRRLLDASGPISRK